MIIGNWKMQTTRDSAIELAESIARQADQTETPLGICPPMIWLDPVCQSVAGSRLWVGAQDCVGDPNGAQTGCVNVAMIQEAGAGFSVLGHSERRARFGETTEQLLPAIAAVLEAGLFPVVCVGETLAERERGEAQTTVADQLAPLLTAGLDLSGVVIAYEPVWAIGTGLSASADDIDAMHHGIRSVLGREDSLVLYGGSVSPDSASEVFSSAEVSGALVGGASLNSESFAAIVAAWEQR